MSIAGIARVWDTVADFIEQPDLLLPLHELLADLTQAVHGAAG